MPDSHASQDWQRVVWQTGAWQTSLWQASVWQHTVWHSWQDVPAEDWQSWQVWQQFRFSGQSQLKAMAFSKARMAF